MVMSAKKIITEYCDNLITDPSFYSAAGNNVRHLNSDMLERIYQGVKKEIGDDAAVSFVSMVDEMEKKGDASATTFLISFYNLEKNKWNLSMPGTIPTTEAEAAVDANRLGGSATLTILASTFKGAASNGGGEWNEDREWARQVTLDFLWRRKNESSKDGKLNAALGAL